MRSTFRSKYILNYIGVWLSLFIVFGGAYKSPIGNISTAHLIFLWAVLIVVVYSNGFSFLWFKEWLNSVKYYNFYFVVLFSLFLISACQYVFLDVGDDVFFRLQIKYLSLLILSVFFFPIIVYAVIWKLSSREIFFSVFSFCVFMALFSIAQLFYNEFRLWFLSQTAIDGYWLQWAETNARAIGLKGMSIWDTSVACAILIFICFGILRVGKKEISDKSLFLFMATLFLLVGISGRTGLLFLISFFLLLVCFHQKKKLIYTFLVLVGMPLVFILLFASDSFVLERVNFAFELFVNVLKGDFHTNSTDDLINNHLFIPEVSNFLFGDNIFIGNGNVIESRIGRSSDSAFVINFAAFGWFGVIATLILVFINSKIFSGYFLLARKNKTYFLCFLVSFVLCLGLYVKVPVYITPTLLKAMVFVTVCTNRFRKISVQQNTKKQVDNIDEESKK